MADVVTPAPKLSEVRYSGRTLSHGGEIQHHEGEAFIPPNAVLTIPQKSVLAGLSPDDVALSGEMLVNPLQTGGFSNAELYAGGAKLPAGDTEAAKVIADALLKGDVLITNKGTRQAYIAFRVNVVKKAN